MGNTPSSYQQNEKSYKMFPGNKTSLSVPSSSLEATPRMRLLAICKPELKFVFLPLFCFQVLREKLNPLPCIRTGPPPEQPRWQSAWRLLVWLNSPSVSFTVCAKRLWKRTLARFHTDASFLNITHWLFVFQLVTRTTGKNSHRCDDSLSPGNAAWNLALPSWKAHF